MMFRRQWFRHTAAAAVVAACGGIRPGALTASAKRPASAAPMFVLRNPGCGCCVGWADHLRERGFEVHLHDSPDLTAVKTRLGIPGDLRGCHTAIVEGYVVEGHVPADFVLQLLDDTPPVAGIAVPGMPTGSPGMEGPNPEPFDVVAFGAEGEADRYVLGTVTFD